MSALIDKMRRRAGRYLDVRTVSLTPDKGALSLSFDDIPRSAWTEAGPLLAEHSVLATYYVCGGLAGGSNLDLPQYEVEDLQALHAAGHEVGCHTFEHVSTLTLSPAELEASLAKNAAWVSERLNGYEMRTFAYPFGDCALGSKAVIDRRFLCGRGVRDGVNVARADRNLLQAVGLESRRLPGYDLESLVQKAADEKGWLIAYGHDVSDTPTPYGCTLEDLDRLIRLAKAAGLNIAPVGQVWDQAV